MNKYENYEMGMINKGIVNKSIKKNYDNEKNKSKITSFGSSQDKETKKFEPILNNDQFSSNDLNSKNTEKKVSFVNKVEVVEVESYKKFNVVSEGSYNYEDEGNITVKKKFIECCCVIY